jgi:hypothetical protein
MARKCFFSFHYVPDNWRASQVRQIGKIEGNQAVSDNKWEEVKKGGDSAIKKWIDDQLTGKSCLIVLAGENTADRKWINYEIEAAWNAGKGVLAIYIHKLKDSDGNQSKKGKNPLLGFKLQNGKYISSYAKDYDPPFSTSKYVYEHIAENIEDWVEKAIDIRNKA